MTQIAVGVGESTTNNQAASVHDKPLRIANGVHTVEIDIIHSSLDRFAIYAALGVPEIWRFNGQMLRAHLLTPTGDYRESQQSHTFPFLAIIEIERFLASRSGESETALLRRFRAWVRRQIANNWDQ